MVDFVVGKLIWLHVWEIDAVYAMFQSRKKCTEFNLDLVLLPNSFSYQVNLSCCLSCSLYFSELSLSLLHLCCDTNLTEKIASRVSLK